VQHGGGAVVVYCCAAADRGVCVRARAQGVTRHSALTGLQMAHHPNPKGAKEVCSAPKTQSKRPQYRAWESCCETLESWAAAHSDAPHVHGVWGWGWGLCWGRGVCVRGLCNRR
jgi:hypothetical protein